MRGEHHSYKTSSFRTLQQSVGGSLRTVSRGGEGLSIAQFECEGKKFFRGRNQGCAHLNASRPELLKTRRTTPERTSCHGMSQHTAYTRLHPVLHLPARHADRCVWLQIQGKRGNALYCGALLSGTLTGTDMPGAPILVTAISPLDSSQQRCLCDDPYTRIPPPRDSSPILRSCVRCGLWTERSARSLCALAATATTCVCGSDLPDPGGPVSTDTFPVSAKPPAYLFCCLSRARDQSAEQQLLRFTAPVLRRPLSAGLFRPAHRA
jgi:hypothetical protein